MRLVLVVLGVAGLAFCWWGLSTVPGRRAFDEMAGMIPLAAGAAGALLLLAAVAAWWRSRGG